MKNKILVSAVLGLAMIALVRSFGKPVLAQVRAALIRDMDNPALQPISFSLTAPTYRFAVPAGKRLVIRYMSWRGTVNQGFVTAQGVALITGGHDATFYLPGSPVSGENIGGGEVFLIADPNTTVLYQSAGSIGNTSLDISGYYVDVP